MNNFQLQTIIKLNKRKERNELIGSGLIVALIAALGWLFFMIAPVEASSSPTMQFRGDVRVDCLNSSQYACYRRDLDTMFFSLSTIPPDRFAYIFFHEYGHALTLAMPPEKLIPMFGDDCYEDAANSFYLFVQYPTLRTPESIAFWSGLLK